MIGRCITELGPSPGEVGTIETLEYDASTDIRLHYDASKGYAMIARHTVIFEVQAGVNPEQARERWAECVEVVGQPLRYPDLTDGKWAAILSDAILHARAADLYLALEGIQIHTTDDYQRVRKDIKPAALRRAIEDGLQVILDTNEDVLDAVRRLRKRASKR